MKRTLSTLIAILSITSVFAQEDSAQVSILPYYEPMHSDRPGATFDAQTVKQNPVLQFGVGQNYWSQSPVYYNSFSSSNTGATLRIPTPIGEIDASIGYSKLSTTRTSWNGLYVNTIENINQSRRAGIGYRAEMYSSEKFTVGGLINVGYDNYRAQNSSFGIPRVDTLNVTYSELEDITHFLVASGYINLHYSLNDRWSLSSSIGVVGPFTIGAGSVRDMSGIVTLNLGYSWNRWSVFAEGVTQFSRGSTLSSNAGVSYAISRDFQLDAFIAGPSLSLENSYFNETWVSGTFVGFTYFIR